ncbi:MAG: lycopene cyclase domain-containing protein [Patescibacteria group bacterium]
MLTQYAYLIGSLILGVAWLPIFLIRKDLRKEMLWMGLLSIPFAFSEFLFVPEYWNPPVLFDLINKIGFGIEDVLFCFFVSSIASVIYEFLTRKKLKKIIWNRKLHVTPYLITIFIFVGLEFIFPAKTIYNAMLALLAAATIIGVRRKDLIPQIIFGGAFFALLYFLLFLVFNTFFPEFITNYYTHKNLWNIYILKVPLEEIAFAFSAGTAWSSLYEYVKGYRLK